MSWRGGAERRTGADGVITLSLSDSGSELEVFWTALSQDRMNGYHPSSRALFVKLAGLVICRLSFWINAPALCVGPEVQIGYRNDSAKPHL
jgi:hypothetical protein